MELKGVRGVVVLAAAGLEASVMVGRGGLSTVCNDCLRNCLGVGFMLWVVCREEMSYDFEGNFRTGYLRIEHHRSCRKT